MYTHIPVTCAFIYYLSVTSTCALIPQTFKLTCLSQLNSYVYVYRESRQVLPKHIFCVLKFTSRNIPKACTPKNYFCVHKTQSHEHSQNIYTYNLYLCFPKTQPSSHVDSKACTQNPIIVHRNTATCTPKTVTYIHTQYYNHVYIYTQYHNNVYIHTKYHVHTILSNT